MSQDKPSRRSVLRGAGLAAAGLAAPYLFTMERAFAADEIAASNVGGAPGAAIKAAFCDPFERETGIRVNLVSQEADPSQQFRMIVDTRSFIWDLSMVTPSELLNLTAPRQYCEPLNLPPAANFAEGMLHPYWLGFSVYSTVIAYRTDKFGENGPQNWADFWDVAKFPGRRGLYRNFTGVIEAALMADGVAAHDLYPMNLDRAFRKLDEIRPHIAVWWSTGAQPAQLLVDREVVMTSGWNGRFFELTRRGAPVATEFAEGSLRTSAWGIPRGTRQAYWGQKLFQTLTNPRLQAAYATELSYAGLHPDTMNYVPPEIRPLLPAAPENLQKQFWMDIAWWTENGARAQERWNRWMLRR